MMFDFDKNTKDKIILWLMSLLTVITVASVAEDVITIYVLKQQPNYTLTKAIVYGIFGIIGAVCGIKQYANNRKFGVEKIKQCVNDVVNDEENC